MIKKLVAALIIVVAITAGGCYGNVASAASQSEGTLSSRQDVNVAHYRRVSIDVLIGTIAVVGALWVGLVVFLFSRKKSFVYLLLFTVFYFYLYSQLSLHASSRRRKKLRSMALRATESAVAKCAFASA